MHIILLYPPGWSLCVGSPYLSIPLLNAILKSKGYDVSVKDLNWEVSKYYGVRINIESIIKACRNMNLRSLNHPYFLAESKLNEIAQEFNGTWNLQLGFIYNNYSYRSSNDIFLSTQEASPFTKYYYEKVLPWINRKSPRIIALSITSAFQIIPAFQLIWMLRKNGYKDIIIIGGNIISRLIEEMKIPRIFKLVDVLVVFQGETPLALISDAIRDCKNYEGIPSIIWWENGNVKVNPVMVKQNLNLIPCPDFDGLPIGEYWGINYLPIVASRGCYYGRCSFCSIPYGWGCNGYAGTRDAKLVYQDMINLKSKYGINKFKFVDETFAPSMLEALAKLIINNSDEFNWEIYARLERHWQRKSFVRLLSKAGLKKVYFGLEIAHSKMRDKLIKNDNARDILTILENCADYNIKSHLFCLFGFPGTGAKEAESTIRFILNHKVIIDTVDINPFMYSKHTNVLGIRKIEKENEDWALEYDYEPAGKDILASAEVMKLTYEFEEMLWEECPRMLHPTYRLLTPWA